MAQQKRPLFKYYAIASSERFLNNTKIVLINNETIITTMEEERADALEMAAQAYA